MEIFIKNRDNHDIHVRLEGFSGTNGLAFVMHGLSGNKDQPHIRAMIDAFLENDYGVVSWDAVHTFGKSTGGNYEDATTTNYYHDLEDVVAWSKSQNWYSEPFVLSGHSLGGIGTALYAQKHPHKVKALAPISTVVSGKLSMQTKEEGREAWQRDGVQVTYSHDGSRRKVLKWSHMEDRMKYDLLSDVHKLTMPVLMVVGDKDTSTPPEHQQILFDKLPGKKQLHIIEGALHSFYEPHEQTQLKSVMSDWIKSLD